jgi:tRNA-Thr(GGU) m(6)t(6)A37 methyltransferase TsaA
MRSDFTGKFGIPRQSGIVSELVSYVVFEPEFRNPDALRGIEGFSHLWLIWQFSENLRQDWSPTVRPPRLGGNTRMGVFATRSPFRPNGLGLSCVELLAVEETKTEGLVLKVGGADLMDGTPIFDVKPYVPYADCKPMASSGFAPDAGSRLKVVYAPDTDKVLPEEKLAALTGVLANDPRPRYQHQPERVYAMDFADCTVRFAVDGDTLNVIEIGKTTA